MTGDCPFLIAFFGAWFGAATICIVLVKLYQKCETDYIQPALKSLQTIADATATKENSENEGEQ